MDEDIKDKDGQVWARVSVPDIEMMVLQLEYPHPDGEDGFVVWMFDEDETQKLHQAIAEAHGKIISMRLRRAAQEQKEAQDGEDCKGG